MQPAPAGARGQDRLSQRDEDICIKLIKKKKKPKPQNKTKPQPCASPGCASLVPSSAQRACQGHFGTADARAGQGSRAKSAPPLPSPSRSPAVRSSPGMGLACRDSPQRHRHFLQCPLPELLLHVPFHPPQPGGLQSNGVRQQSLAAGFPFPWSVAQSPPT